MPTKPLPFHEKDAQRWCDHVCLVESALAQAIRQYPLAPNATLIESALWQCRTVHEDIAKTLEEKRRK